MDYLGFQMGIGPGVLSSVARKVLSTDRAVLEEAGLGVVGDLIVSFFMFEERQIVGGSESPEALLMTK